MEINVITLFPDMVKQTLSYGVIGKAIEQGLLVLNCFNPRDFADNKHRRVDDKPFGGGAGMVMMYDPLIKTLDHIKRLGSNLGQVIFLSPQGEKMLQSHCNEWAKQENITLICGRYEGVDQRFIEEHVDLEISIGDYVISGGEMAACVAIDALGRQIEGVLGSEESAASDSFMNGRLGYPQYTRSDLLGQSGVPSVLLSGHHEDIRKWRDDQSLKLTKMRRPELLEGTSES
ncbi:tRNA (guanosine(37)-N1)-methyltransferase TrmD [Marinicella litoralis]|uniref:tRNA (guanine-N(1)-)-methyltransferase n=1 Tax=Marinicella litoralis TaxID=644220 RepID=A0A4R6XJ09_9GAMM|nr:tRNA (guanosine(37)-N1)-methyltransferase TrmD [Marinicella litoralis]TDR19486.1 tRNA (guanine37-N(1)-) methyltransferase [Marinicella litoralis]